MNDEDLQAAKKLNNRQARFVEISDFYFIPPGIFTTKTRSPCLTPPY